MRWFPLQGIMMHAADSIQCPAENLKKLLNLFSMFKVNIIYDETIGNKYVPDAAGIMCINCGKRIHCSLDNQKI